MAKTLLTLDQQMTHRVLARLSGKDPSWVEEMLYGKYRERTSRLYSFETGGISTEEFIRALRFMFDINPEVEDRVIKDAFTRYVWFSEKMRGLLHRLRHKGFIQGLISNNNQLQCDHILVAFPTLRLVKYGGVMDLHVFSHEVGFVKPEREIYETAFLKAAECSRERGDTHDPLRPHECLFFDDIGENVDAAIEFGICAAVVDRGYEGIIEVLENFGVHL